MVGSVTMTKTTPTTSSKSRKIPSWIRVRRLSSPVDRRVVGPSPTRGGKKKALRRGPFSHLDCWSASYEGGVVVTGPTSTDCGLRHPVELSFTETKLSGSVILTRSKSLQGPALVATSFQ